MPLRTRPLLPKVVAVLPLTSPKALVPLLHDLDDLLWRHLFTLRLRQCIGLGQSPKESAAHKPERGRNARHPEKLSTV